VNGRASIDVGEIIDGAAFRGLPRWVAAFSFAVMIADGFDIQSMAFAAPALTAEWGVRREWLGPVLAASIVGMAAGSVVLGWLGDRIGRKSAFCASVALLAAGSFASSLAGGLGWLVLYRFATGVGLGGAAPSAAAFVAEWTPRRWRGTVVSIVVVAIPFGGMLGAALAQHIIPAYGWRSVFVFGAIFPVIFLMIALARLPEIPGQAPGPLDRTRSLVESATAAIRTPHGPRTLCHGGARSRELRRSHGSLACAVSRDHLAAVGRVLVQYARALWIRQLAANLVIVVGSLPLIRAQWLAPL